MPFKLKLKKSRQYNVMSKNLFVICVEMLDGSIVDCTLSNQQSKGLECLENICQKISIQQPEFFGLRYVAKATKNGNEMEMRWVDLERPLNRQLEKYASSKTLYLRVMYYVISGVSLILDEVTRNYYFLQLKQDIVEGKISCDPKQAVILANYSRQAEYGNFRSDRHTVDYLKSLLSFPKHLIESGLLEALTEEVIKTHEELHNVTQAAAEELYISACQQLDGYGQETFIASGNDSLEVMLGISVSGIIVAGSCGTHKFYPWRDITNVVNHKKTFNIECTDQQKNLGFNLQDAETGRYVWKLTILQHTFFMNYEQNQTSASQANLSLFQNLPDNFNESREDLISDDKPFYNETQLSSNTNLSMFKNVQNKWLTSSESLINNHLKPGMPLQTSMAFDINLSNNAISTANNYNWNPSGSNASLTNYRAQSTSDVNLSNSNVNLNDSSKERLKLLLPTYRPAPDYETAIQHKYRDRNLDNYLHPDVTQVTNSAHYSDASDYGMLQHRFNIPKPPPPYPTNRLSSTSTPDLHHRGLFAYRGIQISGSSPDLVSSRTLLNQSSLIPKYPMNTIYPPNIKQRLRHSHSFLPHATYENLNIIETANPDSMIYRTSSAAGAIAQQMNMEHFLQNRHHRYIMKSLNGLNLSNTHVSEPIYENVPLPLTQYDYELNRVGLQQNVQEVTPRLASNPIALARKPPQTFLKTNNNNNSTNQLFNNNNNNNNNTSTSISSFNKEFDINNVSASISSINLSESMQNNNISTQLKQKANNTTQNSANTTFSTESNVTDSSSTCMSGKTKEKRSRIWSILSGGGGKVKSVSSSKQNLETTLRKDKQKSKKVPPVTQDRWSTGLPKGLPLPANISKESLCELLETKLNDSQLALEFERINKRKENASFSCALMEENSNKNIDLNFLPYDDNRVRLTPTKDNKYGYYNASHITSTVGQKQRFYIVAQSAKDNMNANIFWQCVWEADVYLLIQLSDELTYVPNNSDKCLEYGQYQVWREFSQDTNRCITSKLRVYHTQSRRYRSVWHLIYSNWTDQNCPKDVSHFLKFLEEVNSVRLASIQEIPLGHNTNPPVLIHCDEGFERTGITLVSDLLLYTLDHNQDLDIPRVIGQLRQQRDKIIPSLLQYKFIYSLLIHYLKETRLI